jgi:aminoglycoside phosphotransferase family enzyme
MLPPPLAAPIERQNLARQVAFLRRPQSYPEPTATVEVRETHMSWVFLTDRYAYKLKKPVRRTFLDFSTLERRRANSDAEVRLNGRLAPGVYLGVVPVTREAADGRLVLEGRGEPVEWLVKMRRLPDDALLDRALAAGQVPAERLARAARRLAAFYAESPPVPFEPDAYRRRLAERLESSCAVLSDPRYGLPRARVDAVCTAQRAFLAHHAPMLAARGALVREVHGDLRPEHICLTPEPVIIDCLEFNRDFRLLDPVDELAFLAMECARLGDSKVGQIFLDTYRAASQDSPPPELVAFYQGLWTMLRARLSVWHLDDPEVRDRARWSALALDYLALAERISLERDDCGDDVEQR